MEALSVASLRGVEVEIYIPSGNNVPLVDWAGADVLGIIIEAGCKVYRTQPPFDHSKLMTMDHVWALIGSTNWDPRSLRLNFEFNVECYGEAFNATINDIIDSKAAGAMQITQQDIADRSMPRRLRDGAARLLSPYL